MSVAKRVAEEMHVGLGEKVGSTIGFKDTTEKVRTSDFSIQTTAKTFSTLPSTLISYTPSPSLPVPIPSTFPTFLSSIGTLLQAIHSSEPADCLYIGMAVSSTVSWCTYVPLRTNEDSTLSGVRTLSSTDNQ
ncbi:uncharacterized protein C8R40DRAFT_157982 [Lentinula edodes]|uniref:uncharacterized protein n=1 Tax=Lentinula edodes TaxID=5353 RepID=UPI001E8CFBF7|nr:uncharacterized protein C8R40DRAFT_157982 [Lentinula edodes]KAH7876225.1 hypothetical protein C8R40DRAFT_157982 [Lentinula edodes]